MDNTQATVKALRAISALSLRHLLHPAVVMTVILLGATYVITILLALVFSKWWLLLLIILVPLSAIGGILYFILRYTVSKLMPTQLTKSERSKISVFVDRLVDIADRSRTPYPIMLLLIAKDVLRGKESDFLKSLIGDSRDLLKEFSDIKSVLNTQY